MSGSGQSARWVIEHRSTGAWLGVHTRAAGIEKAEFGGRVPLLFGDLRMAKAEWVRHCVRQRYYKPGVSLTTRLENLLPGPEHSALPEIVYTQIMLVPTLFSVREDAGHA